MGLRSRFTRLLSTGQGETPASVHAALPRPTQDDPVRNPECSSFEVDGWAVSSFVVQKLVPVTGVHPFPLQELMMMTAAVCRLKPSMIFEWGTNIGKSARIFHEVACHYRIPVTIHSIDLPDDIDHVEHPHGQRGVMVRGLDHVHLHQGDGLSTALALWNEAGRPADPLFFIDGDHSRESVSRELEGILAAVPRPGVLLHDTFFQSAASGYNVGPHQAIEAALAAHPGRFQRVDTNLSLPGMTLLVPAGDPAGSRQG